MVIFPLIFKKFTPKIKAILKGPWVRTPDMKCAAILNLEVVNNVSMKYASCKGIFLHCTGLRGILNYSVFELCPGRVSALPLLTADIMYVDQE